MRHLEDGEAMALMAWASVTPFRDKHVSDFLVHVPNQGLRHARVGAKFKRMGMRPGFPDYFLHVVKFTPSTILPIGGLIFEFKHTHNAARRKPTLTELQREQLAHLAACGYETGVAYGWQEAARMICDYLGIRCNVPCDSRP